MQTQNALAQLFPVNALAEYFARNLYFLKSDSFYVKYSAKDLITRTGGLCQGKSNSRFNWCFKSSQSQ